MELISDKTFKKYYSERNFWIVWIKSLSLINNKFFIILYSLSNTIFITFFPFEFPFDFANLFKNLQNILFTFSITVLGFFLISFTIVASILNTKGIFKHFNDDENTYKQPLIKVLLLYFITPIGFFILNLIHSFILLIFQIFDLSHLNSFHLFYFLSKISLSYLIIILSLSVLELVSYFYNIYQFLSLYFFLASKDYEKGLIVAGKSKDTFSPSEKNDYENIDKNVQNELKNQN
ncbi:hypothetical protein LEP1GSC199_0640 [Leptospira vanthielii serovar Holland str. Waz Holland = ATCC 700522]|uniref:Uncharacterized protein n=1 Tax=Leptospira vanthielii serovar Holland str. Waz Holland = ATCC 700522 TaxID=1218591 RepID=N1W6Q4_9LEPT|nr:hypothetical protein LEP1GSC199_0640 [Leptospira vanthielii serovar Holland str. Waz Holland = ATCC 700522]